MAVNTVGWKGRWASWMRNNAYAVHLRKMILGASIGDSGALEGENLRLYRHADDDLKGLVIDQDGDATSLDIDSEAADETVIVNVTPGGGSEGAFSIIRNDAVTGNVVMRLGNNYLWTDTTGDLRIHNADPTSDAGVGTVVGDQS